MRRFLILSTLILCLFACEGSDPRAANDAGLDASLADDASLAGDASASEDAGAPSDADAGGGEGDLERDYCAPLAALVCGRAASCGCGVVVPSGELDVDGCSARWTDKCMRSFGAFADAVALGRARVIKARAAACVERIEQLTPSCQRPSGIVPFALCEPFIVSDTPIGEACSDVPWCAAGAGVCLENECIARRARDERCSNEVECATGLACLGGVCKEPGDADAACEADAACMPPLRCVQGACAVLLAENTDCTETLACEQGLVCAAQQCEAPSASTCTGDASCGNLEVCAAPRVCTPRGGVDADCVSDRDCELSSYCGAEQRCVTRPGLDETCGNGVACAQGLACDPPEVADPRCRALPTEGQACALDSAGPFVCGEGLGCIDGMCAELPKDGEPCTIDSRCAPGLACDFTAEGSFCVQPKATGELCQNDVVCGPDAHCGPEGTCTPDLANGAPCSLGNECAGVCGPDATGGVSCQAAPGAAERCVSDDDCASPYSCRADPATTRCVPELCREL